MEPKPTRGEWEYSYEACTSNQDIFKIKYNIINTALIMITLSQKSQNLILDDQNSNILIKQYMNLEWTTFDQYKNFLNQVHIVEKTSRGIQCSCKFFGKHHYCIHEHQFKWKFEGGKDGNLIPTICQREKVTSFVKRKRGRPAKVETCLQRAPPLIARKENTSPERIASALIW